MKTALQKASETQDSLKAANADLQQRVNELTAEGERIWNLTNTFQAARQAASDYSTNRVSATLALLAQLRGFRPTSLLQLAESQTD